MDVAPLVCVCTCHTSTNALVRAVGGGEELKARVMEAFKDINLSQKSRVSTVIVIIPNI